MINTTKLGIMKAIEMNLWAKKNMSPGNCKKNNLKKNNSTKHEI
jgi:hypothetical protein